jgi:hypothetical protein
MTVTIWYKDTVSFGMDGYANAIPPKAPLIKATIISSQRWGWHKVLTADGKFDTVNDQQIFFTQQGRGKRMTNKDEKYPLVPIHWTPFELWWNCFAWQIGMLLLCNIAAAGIAWGPDFWKVFPFLQIVPGLFVYGFMIAWIFNAYEGYALVKKYQGKP